MPIAKRPRDERFHRPASSGSSSVIEVAKQHKFGLSAAIVIVLAVIAAAGYGAYSLLRTARSAPFDNFTISQLTNTGNSQLAAISPDGKYLLRVVSDAGKQSLWLRHVPTNSDTQVIAPADTSFPASHSRRTETTSISARQ